MKTVLLGLVLISPILSFCQEPKSFVSGKVIFSGRFHLYKDAAYIDVVDINSTVKIYDVLDEEWFKVYTNR